MAYDFSALAESPRLDILAEGQANLIVSARLWVTMRKRGIDPAPLVAQRFGSEGAAWQFWLLMEEVGTAWPDPFLVSPPCCPRMSYDEALLLDMLHHAAGDSRAEFIALVAEMLPVEIAERLYASARSFLSALPQPVSPG